MKSNAGIYFLIDRSTSTKHIIDNIRNALAKFIDLCHASPKADNLKMYVSILLFNHTQEYICKSEPLDTFDINKINWEASGCTDIGAAITKGINDSLVEYKKWDLSGEERVHPCIILLTDGYPDAGVDSTPEEQNEYEDRFSLAATEIKADEDVKFTFGAAGICGGGYGADMEKLGQLTNIPERVIALDGNFPKEAIEGSFFDFIVRTVTENTLNQMY